MRRAWLLLGVLALATLPAPAASADTYTIEVLDADDRPREEFLRDEAVHFRVTVQTTSPRTIEHRLHVYRGEGTSGSEVAVVEDGTVTNTMAGQTFVFRLVWDQKVAGSWVGAERYTAQFRGPTHIVTRSFDLEYNPDFAVTFLRVDEVDALPFVVRPQQHKAIVGCVQNLQQPTSHVDLTVSARSALAPVWWPQLTHRVAFSATPCPYPGGEGTPFSLPFFAAVSPAGLQLREVRVEANADGSVWERDRANNVRAAPASWLL